MFSISRIYDDDDDYGCSSDLGLSVVVYGLNVVRYAVAVSRLLRFDHN